MRTLSTFLLLAVVVPAVASSPDPKRLAVPPEELAKARDLVRQLGSEVFEEREDAQDRLAKMGRLAKPVLATALHHDPDPEVRSRCRALLPRAAADDLKARLDTFLADADGKFEHDMPGWNEFKAVTGGAGGARELFVEMLADPTNRALVMGVGGADTDLGTLVAARKTEMYNWRFPRVANAVRRDPAPVEIAALLFAESHVESRNVPRTIAISTLFLTPGFNSSVLDGSEKGAATKALVVKWLETRDDPVQMYQAITVAGNLGLKEASGVAAKLLTAGGGSASYRLNAAYAIARHGAKEHAAALEKSLGDTTAITSTRIVNGERFTTDYQVRDAALAALLMLSGQNTEDYGFVELNRGTVATARYTYTARTLAEDDRKKAFEKWKAWRAKNPDWAKQPPKK